MTTAEFINRNFGVTSTKDRKCSSVYADHEGNIFSYGPHYPLLFTVDGLSFRNCTGYSNTTAKHINWAGGHGAIDVWVQGTNLYTWRNGENSQRVPHLLHLASYGMTPVIETALKMAIVEDLDAEYSDIKQRMESKKRKDTQVYRSLEAEMADCESRIKRVNDAWGQA